MLINIRVLLGENEEEEYECSLEFGRDSKQITKILLLCSKICQEITGEKEPDLDLLDLPIDIQIGKL